MEDLSEMDEMDEMDGGAQGSGASAAQINDQMLMAVASGDTGSLRRAIERGAGEWLGSAQSRSDDPLVNPVLAALLSPFGFECMEEFDAFFGDMRAWTHGRWNCAHWAVAGKNEAALAWALKKSGRAASTLSVMDVEESGAALGGARRSALALAAQMGDPMWLGRVVEISTLSGEGVAVLARRDKASPVSALGLAVFELACGARDGMPLKEWSAREACSDMLCEMGFPIDGAKAPAAKLCVALALAHPEDAGPNKAMAVVSRRAVAMGSGSWGGHSPAGAYEAAGLALDDDWARALDLCGMSEPKDGSFAMGAAKRMLAELRADARREGWEWGRLARGEAVLRRVGASLAAAPIDLADSPLGGREMEVGRWMIELSKGRLGAGMGVEAFKEGVELGIVSARAAGARAGAKRALRV